MVSVNFKIVLKKKFEKEIGKTITEHGNEMKDRKF